MRTKFDKYNRKKEKTDNIIYLIKFNLFIIKKQKSIGILSQAFLEFVKNIPSIVEPKIRKESRKEITLFLELLKLAKTNGSTNPKAQPV